MLAIHVDPSLLTAPLHAGSRDEARDLIGRLNEVSSYLTRDLLTVSRATDCSEVLATAGVFPAYSSVEQLLLKHNLADEFGAGDVVRMINNILDRAQPALEALDAEAVDLSSCTLTPQIWTGAAGLLEDACQRALATVRHVNAVRAGQVVAASVWPHCAPATGAIHVNAVADIDSASGAHVTLDAQVVGEPPLVRKLDDMASSVVALDVWAAAASPRDYHLAIALRASAIALKPLSSLPSFTVGSAFPDSLSANQAAGGQSFASIALDVCAHVLAGQPKYEVNDFGQSRRDGAESLRTHVTKGNPALRLLMWTKDAELEFANIGPKNELAIQNGNPAAAHRGSYNRD
jgi:hypothetical protein